MRPAFRYLKYSMAVLAQTTECGSCGSAVQAVAFSQLGRHMPKPWYARADALILLPDLEIVFDNQLERGMRLDQSHHASQVSPVSACELTQLPLSMLVISIESQLGLGCSP